MAITRRVHCARYLSDKMSVHRTSLLAGRQVDDLPLSLSLSHTLSLSGSFFFLCSWQEIIKNKLYRPGRGGWGGGGPG